MTRLAILSLLALAVVAWLRRAPQPEPDRAMDDVQPADPVTWPALIAQYDPWRRQYGTGDFWPNGVQWTNTSRSYGTGGNHDAALPPDPTYLEATTLAAIRRSGQSSEVSTEGMS